MVFTGIVLEELQNTSTENISDDDIIDTFDSATDTFFKVLLAGDSKSSLPRSPSSFTTLRTHSSIGQPLEIAFQRSNILNIRQGLVFFVYWYILKLTLYYLNV